MYNLVYVAPGISCADDTQSATSATRLILIGRVIWPNESPYVTTNTWRTIGGNWDSLEPNTFGPSLNHHPDWNLPLQCKPTTNYNIASPLITRMGHVVKVTSLWKEVIIFVCIYVRSQPYSLAGGVFVWVEICSSLSSSMPSVIDCKSDENYFFQHFRNGLFVQINTIHLFVRMGIGPLTTNNEFTNLKQFLML